MSNKSILLEIFQKNYKLLFRLIYSIAQNIDDTSDILQETFLRAYIHFDPDMEYDHALRWLIMISKNTAKTYVKQNRVYEPLDKCMDQMGEPDVSFIGIFLYEISSASAVPNELFEHLMMHILGGMPLLEISRRHQITYERLRHWKKVLITELAAWIQRNN